MVDSNVEFARGGSRFTADLFQLLSAGDAKENIVFSPFSIQACLALAFAGAKGETADEIAKGLHFASTLPSEMAQTFQFVLEKYEKGNLLKIANKLYVQQGKQLKASYEGAIKEQYHSEAESINFALSDAAAKSINDWVNAKTEGKINQLVTPDALNDNTRLVLLNALHFKGMWLNQFEEYRNKEDAFWIAEQQSAKVQYMNGDLRFGYAEFPDLECTAIEMPYKDSDLSMFVLLPQEREGLKQLAEQLKTVNLVDLADKMVTEQVHVKFPKFKVDYTIDLTEKLSQLGIMKMFTDAAEFDNLLDSSEDIWVSKAVHKATIEVNETGTEASATTSSLVSVTSMPDLMFEADHPFLYFIWNGKNILFAGAFVNPSTAQAM